MKEISFEYKGRQHSAQLISSTTLEPHYHWVYFNDKELEMLINDDCIGFKRTDKGLHPTKIFTVHPELIEKIRSLVEKNIGNS
jgi:hypothetical protein